MYVHTVSSMLYYIYMSIIHMYIYIYFYFFGGCVSEQEIRSLNPIGLLPKSTTNRLWCRGGNIFGHPNQTKIPIWIYRGIVVTIVAVYSSHINHDVIVFN